MAEELEKLERDIASLRKSTRLDWEELATKPMSPHERLERRKAIASRDVHLYDLLQRKWALTEMHRRV